MKKGGLGIVVFLALAAGLSMAFIYAPPDAIQGNVQRIMYLHVPSILVAYLAFSVVFVSSFAYLLRRTSRWDALAYSSAEIGVVFTWGVWWTWDARLTTTALLFVIYAGYLMLRAFIEEPERAARYSAVLGIIGFLDIPLIHMSVVWWRTLHQPSSLIRPEGPAIATPMLFVLLLNVAAYALLYLYLLKERIRLYELEGLVLRPRE